MPNGPLRAEALRAKAVSALSHCLLQASQVVLEKLLPTAAPIASDDGATLVLFLGGGFRGRQKARNRPGICMLARLIRRSCYSS